MGKYLFCFILAFILSCVAHAQNSLLSTRVDINARNHSIKEVIREIEKNYQLKFSYSDDIVPVDKRIHLNLKKVTLDEALQQILANSQIAYKEVGNQIVLYKSKPQLITNQRFTISGFVKEKGSDEPLVGVNIVRKDLSSGTSSNGFGYYSITEKSDSIYLVFSYVGYQTLELGVILDRDMTLNIYLEPDMVLSEVVVAALPNTETKEAPGVSKHEIPIRMIKEIPALLGEKDVLKTLRLMPGIQSGNEAQSGLYVRGGGPDQNLILFDDAVVYNAFHLLGFFSLFNGDAIRSIELTKGGFPARYGGRLSSVLDVNTRDGNKEKWQGEMGIGLISSSITMEGPLKKNQGSVLVSARRTYLDQVLKPFFSKEQDMSLYFYDIITKTDWVLSDKDKLQWSFYHGRDHYFLGSGDEQFSNRGGTDWQNITSSLRWNRVVKPRLYMKTALLFSNYNLKVESSGVYDFQQFLQKVYSAITDVGLKSDFVYQITPKRTWRFGAISTFHYFVPQGYYEFNELNELELDGKQSYRSLESGIYAEDQTEFNKYWSSQVGIRYNLFMADARSYLRAEPRLGLRYSPNSKNTWKANYTMMHQFVHLLSTTGIGLPTDLWVPSTRNIGPQRSHQWALGYQRIIPKWGVTASLESYLKLSDGVIGYKEGATFVEVNGEGEPVTVNWEEVVTQGKGTSYGLEALLEKKAGRLSGWLGYTLSWTYLQFDELNRGERFFARYDRRHDISLVGSFRVNRFINLSATWVFGTGQAVNLPEAGFYSIAHEPGRTGFQAGFPGTQVIEYGLRNQYRMGNYHRMDVGIQFKLGGPTRTHSIELSAYNLYNRRNPYYYYIVANSNGSNSLKQMSLFPILPSLSYSYKF